MCRLLGMVTNRAIDERVLLEFRQLADRGKTPKDYGCPQISTRTGHQDGWGITCVAEDGEVYRRSHLNASSDPDYEDAVREVGGLVSPPFVLVAHLRRAARQETLRQEFNQPFVRELGGRTVFFAHNGNVEGYGVRDGKIDSQMYFERLLGVLSGSRLSSPEFRKSLGVAKEGIAREFPKKITSLTFLMADGRELVAHRDARQCKPYYSLHETRVEGAYVVCSEILSTVPGTWRLLRNDETVAVKDSSV